MEISITKLRLKWTVVRGFGKVKYFNISYIILFLVPILVELYEKAASNSEFFRNVIAFPPTLKWLYAASFAYAIGIAIYQYRCPELIKRFSSSHEYVEHLHSIFLRAHAHHRLNIVLPHLDPVTDAEILGKIDNLIDKRDSSDNEKRREIEKELDDILSALHPDAVQRYLVKEYDAKNEESPVALWVSFILYVLGTCILVALLNMARFSGFILTRKGTGSC